MSISQTATICNVEAATANITDLFNRLQAWYEQKYGPLPIKPKLKIFPSHAAYLKYFEDDPAGKNSHACCAPTGHTEITVFLHADMAQWKLHSQCDTILHELIHCREFVENGNIVIPIVEPQQKTREREIRVSYTAFCLMAEFIGMNVPPIVHDYLKGRLNAEL